MSTPTVYDAFEVRLRSNWTTTPLVFENEFHQIPGQPEPFVFVEIFGDTFNQETTGAPQANMWLETGATYMHVMVPSGQGSRLARQYANSLLYLFREQAVDGLIMTEMSVGAGDPGKDFPNHWALTATILWQRRDITSIPTP
jgi:hypothetical protein